MKVNTMEMNETITTNVFSGYCPKCDELIETTIIYHDDKEEYVCIKKYHWFSTVDIYKKMIAFKRTLDAANHIKDRITEEKNKE